MVERGGDSLESSCLLLYAKKDKGLQSYFIQVLYAADRDLQSRWRALDTSVQFLESDVCRFSGILTYFKDTTRLRECGHCDICLPQVLSQVPKPTTFTSLSRTKMIIKRKLLPFYPQLTHKAQCAEILREWRKAYAEEHDLPAFVVFSNKSMEDLAIKNPKTLEVLSEVYGFGAKKVEHLGPTLLSF